MQRVLISKGTTQKENASVQIEKELFNVCVHLKLIHNLIPDLRKQFLFLLCNKCLVMVI